MARKGVAKVNIAEVIDISERSETSIFVGKDILELLSSSMYVNPLTIYREYVQNSTDAIDEAAAAGLLSSTSEGKIEFSFDRSDRRLTIRDNGAGLANADFSRKMLSFGASEKRGTGARGFRGVGRLAGLGYVQELVFRSRANGNADVLEAVWDGRVVKQLLASTDSDADLETIVQRSMKIKQIDPEDYPSHFFEVELRKPRRIANDKLLNEAEIEFYLAQSCPCPFAPEFSYGAEIFDLLAPYERAGKRYNIFLAGSETPVFRPYRDAIVYSDTKSAALGRLKTYEIEGLDGDLTAIGWLIHHDYQGAIPASQRVRGLRARVGNFQIGTDRLFSEVFPEERFCSWTIGEVHFLGPRVVPNGRRDDFETNVHLDNVLMHLRPLAAEVARECRVSSQRRNRIKTFELAAGKVSEKLEIIRQSAVSQQYAKEIKGEVGMLLGEMERATGFELFDEEEKSELLCRFDEIETQVEECAKKTGESVLDGLPERHQKLYKEVFDLIYDCSVNQVAARSLIDRMLGRLSRM